MQSPVPTDLTPPFRGQHRLNVAEVWVVCMAAFGLLWGCYVWITAAFGGRGIAIAGSEFVMRQGSNLAKISQGFGWFLFFLTSVMWLLLLASTILGIRTRYRHGTIRIDILSERSLIRAGLITLLTYCGYFFVLSSVGYCVMIFLH